ncbi:MAG: hypothetical protein EXS05_02280 [Planctomycetaceae bacterium]|nr:hypothetical protein [Planctomycetaceae bacterium]
MVRWKDGRVIAIVILAIAGCGGGSTRPALHKVVGKVTVNGTPLADADVAFHPVDGAKVARGATGRTQGDGSFVMGTYTNSDGVISGEYKVVVTKIRLKVGIDPKSLTAAPPTGTSTSSSSANAENYSKVMIGERQSATEQTADVPEKYGKAETTDLRAVVSADSPNEFNFDLK